MTKLLLPCAGYGSRMLMKENQSKELLLHNGKPLIEFSLDLAKQYDLSPLVITRKEKTDLIEYCKNNNIEVQIIEVNGEWPDTVLKSKPHWEENNFLILPDTIFEPKEEAIEELSILLNCGNNYVFGIHEADDISKWGALVDGNLIEKPNSSTSGSAWGIIGFKKDHGEELLEHCSKKQSFKLNDYDVFWLDSFKDLTRTGKIE